MNNRMILAAFSSIALIAAMTLPAGAQPSNFPLPERMPAYELEHPLKITCASFLDTEAIYRPYIVAWLSGRAVGVLDAGDPDEVVQVTIPQVVNRCGAQPDEAVWELVKTK